jgi:transketolase
MRNTFINTILDVCKVRDDIMILSGDAGLGVFDQFKVEYPERYRNMGIAEQNTASFAAGLALTGFKVIIYNIIPFLLYRCYEQVRNDICYQNLPVVLVGIGSGVTYATQGMSHYSVEDIGIAQTLPNLVTISPMDTVEAHAAACFALECSKPVYVRLAKHGEPVFHNVEPIDITAPLILRQGEGTAVLFHGSVAGEVMAAYEDLNSKGIDPMVVSVPMVQPLDVSALIEILSEIRHVIIVEEHFSNCGLGSMLARLRAERSLGWKLSVLAISPHYIHEVKKIAAMRTSLGIAAADIVRTVEAG